MAVCKGCAQPIVWAFTTSGKKMPLNPEPDPARGNVQLRQEPNYQLTALVLSYERARLDREKGLPLHTSHHSTCPKADEFRR